MKEIELKILNVGHKELEMKLVAFGFKKVFDGVLEAIFFDSSDKKLKNSMELLRLRKEGEKVFLTHKTKMKSTKAKICDETEIEVSNFDDTKKIVEKLGYIERKRNQKRRISFKKDNVKIEFDKFTDKNSFVPEYLEIESDDIDKIYEIIELIGYSKEDCVPWNESEVIKHYS